jgi:hypothetical protein
VLTDERLGPVRIVVHRMRGRRVEAIRLERAEPVAEPEAGPHEEEPAPERR